MCDDSDISYIKKVSESIFTLFLSSNPSNICKKDNIELDILFIHKKNKIINVNNLPKEGACHSC